MNQLLTGLAGASLGLALFVGEGPGGGVPGCGLRRREFLAGPRQGNVDAPPIPVFRGRGVQPGVDLTDNAALEAIMDAEP